MPAAYEVNFDGLVGPTHNYAGLAYGNIASLKHKLAVSNPKAAALEGLAKMKLLHDLGVKQAVLPPHERPDVQALRRLGFSGSDADVLQKARKTDPTLLASCSSASSMWAANAATVSPSADTLDDRLHLTPANLVSQFHRSLEPPTTALVLRKIFTDERHFVVHPPLPASLHFSDEGAANHTRLCRAHGEAGIELFAYGRRAMDHDFPRPKRYPARQTHEASSAVARLHQLDSGNTFFVAQNPAAIDAGVFHNDVISVGSLNVLLYHESAFADEARFTDELRRRFAEVCASELILIRASEAELPISQAIESYLFNSQLVQLPDGSLALIAPKECREIEAARRFIERLLAKDNPIRAVHYIEVRQSMKNGGGPACLRLRVVLTEDELAAAKPSVFFTPDLHHKLASWIERHYRDELSAGDLADPSLLDESRTALDELTRLLDLGCIYPFQRTSAL